MLKFYFFHDIKFIYLLFLIFIVNFGAKGYEFRPNLPVGEYRVNLKALVKCDTPNSKIHTNLYLYKVSTNTITIRGNLSFEIPLNDSLTFHINLAVKDLIGGWKDNAHIYETKKACTTFKNLLGNEWSVYLNSFGIKDFNCPIRPGVYVSKGNGFDMSWTELRTNFPKTFFYGTYKSRMSYKDIHKVEHGCIVYVIEIKRPWETD